MQPLDYKYIGLISSHLPLFTRKRDGTYNFRCILCGDSQTNKTKKRGFLLAQGDRVTYYCHNCNASLSLPNLIKHIDVNLFEEYQKEKLAEKYISKQTGITAKPRDITRISFPKYLRSHMKELVKVSSLRYDHPAKKYVDLRKIPTKHHHKLFFANKFKTWVNSLIPDKFSMESGKDEARLVIPFIDMDGSLIGFTGRSFDPNSKLRYITIAVDTEKPMLYGLDNIDKSKRIYVTEGPIDSLFLPNCIAMSSSNNFDGLKTFIDDPTKFIIVMDNEPKNKEICRIVEKAVDLGYSVCIWPNHVEQKDINEMVLSGISPENIKLIIDNNTYSGLQAKATLMQWKKC